MRSHIFDGEGAVIQAIETVEVTPRFIWQSAPAIHRAVHLRTSLESGTFYLHDRTFIEGELHEARVSVFKAHDITEEFVERLAHSGEIFYESVVWNSYPVQGHAFPDGAVEVYGTGSGFFRTDGKWLDERNLERFKGFPALYRAYAVADFDLSEYHPTEKVDLHIAWSFKSSPPRVEGASMISPLLITSDQMFGNQLAKNGGRLMISVDGLWQPMNKPINDLFVRRLVS